MASASPTAAANGVRSLVRLVQREKQRPGRTLGIQFSQLKNLDSELLSQLKKTLPHRCSKSSMVCYLPIDNPILRNLQSGKTVTFDGQKPSGSVGISSIGAESVGFNGALIDGPSALWAIGP